MKSLLLAVLGCIQDPTTVEGPPPVSVLPASGTLAVWRAVGDRTELLDKASKVWPADRLGTPGGEPARFTTEGPLLVHLKNIRAAAGKGLSIERKADRLALRLFKGTAIVESFESEIELETPFGKAAGRQVCFVATVDEGSAKVIAIEGRIRFSNDLGSVTLSEGQSTTIEKGKAPDAPKTASHAEPEPAANLLRNPGFEEKFDDWPIVFEPVAEDLKVYRSGRRSLRCSPKDWAASNPLIPPKAVKGVLKPGSRYLFRFFLRSEGWVRDGKPALIKIVVDAQSKGAMAPPHHHVEVPVSEGAWSARRVFFEALGPDATFHIHAATEAGLYSGTLWFDDFALVEFPAAPKKETK
jgi:hypothetical protein